MSCPLCKDKLSIDLTAFARDIFSGITFDFTLLPEECKYCGQYYLPHSDVQILRNKIMDDITRTGKTTFEAMELLKKLSGSN
jgi:hypothetical protein